MPSVDSSQIIALSFATLIVAVASGVILWREMGRGAEGGFLPGWRDRLGLAATLGGLAVLLTWIWSAA